MKPIQQVGVVAGCVVLKDARVLLVQEKQAKAYKLWNLPAGRVDEGESIETAAVREILEETGYHVELGRKLPVEHVSAKQSVLHAYTATITGGELTVAPDEILDAQWYSLQEVRELHRTGQLRVDWVLQCVEAAFDALEPQKPVEISAEAQALITRKLANEKLMTIATTGPSGQPQAAVVEFATTPELEIILDTYTSSRKFANITRDPRVACVIGWDDNITVQIEGRAQQLQGDELQRCKAIYFAKNARAKKWEHEPGITYVKITPTWIRYSDLNHRPWTIHETVNPQETS